jgi:hypothetical protein
MLTMHRALFAAVVVVSASVSAAAQEESVMRDFFEGKSVVIKMDMPATQQGVDIFPDARQAVDLKQYSQRVKSFGIAVKKGESVMITRVHVKDKLIEFQLDGGGYGTFGDDTGSVSTPSVPKSQREKDLEKGIKTEDDPYRKARMQRELDRAAHRRERQDAANKAASASATEAKRLGSPAIACTADRDSASVTTKASPSACGRTSVMRALSDYVDFTFADDRPSHTAPQMNAQPSAAAPAPVGLQKAAGANLRTDVARGSSGCWKADQTSTKTEGSLKIVTATFTRGDQEISADFIEGVLVKYSISSR